MSETIDPVGRSAMNKAFWRILPPIALAYLCAYIDRVNVSFAAAEMNADLGFSATVYGLGAGLFFLGYALFEIPSNLMAVRYGSRNWLARIAISWGLLSAATMLVQTPWQFYTVRFLLGVAEAGFYPGVIYYFSHWFPPCHRGRAVSRFFVASPLASVVMGAVSGWLLDLDGVAGLHGWQWLFLMQGLPTVLIGLLIWWLLPDRPADVAWLSADEKAWIASELAREQERIGVPPRHGLLSALRNPRVAELGIFGLLLIATITTLVLSAPLVLTRATGLDTGAVGWIVSLGGLLGAGVMLWAGGYADRRGARFPDALLYCCIVSTALLALALTSSPMVTIAAYLVFAATCFSIPMLTSSGWTDVLSARELAVGAAAINTVAQVGAFVAPFAWGALRDSTGNFQAGLFMLFGLSCLMSLTLWHICRKVRPVIATGAAIA